MFFCAKCAKPFTCKRTHDLHTNSIIPCDLTCVKCSKKYKSKKSYSKHICKPKKYTEEQIQKIQKINQTNVNVQNTIAKITNNRIGTNIGIVGDNGNQNNINLALNVKLDTPDKTRMELHGITPHGQEIGELYGYHCADISNLITKYLEGNRLVNTHDPRVLQVLVVTIIQLFYSNGKHPEHINIMDDEPEGERNKVYSGSEFIPDVMPKIIRNRRILQILLSILKQHANDGSNKSPRVKKFIIEVLVPHIIGVYLHDGYHETLQYVWGNNTEIIKGLDISEIPLYIDLAPDGYNNVIELREQVHKYQVEDTQILHESVIYRALDLDSIHEKLDELMASTNPIAQRIENGYANSEPKVEEPPDKDDTQAADGQSSSTAFKNENTVESVEERIENKRQKILASAGLSKTRIL